MDANTESITEPQEWIDGLIDEYSPVAKDIDIALQNMGLKIRELEAERDKAHERIAELESAFADRVKVIELQLEDKNRLAEALQLALKSGCYLTKKDWARLRRLIETKGKD